MTAITLIRDSTKIELKFWNLARLTLTAILAIARRNSVVQLLVVNVPATVWMRIN